MPELFELALEKLATNQPSLRSVDLFLLRQMQLLRDDGSTDPAFMFIGPNNLAAKLFGEEFCNNAPGLHGLPDRKFNDCLNGSYAEASWTRQPVFEFVTGICAGFWVAYNRLVIPFIIQEKRYFASFIDLKRMGHVLQPSTISDHPLS